MLTYLYFAVFQDNGSDAFSYISVMFVNMPFN